MSIIVGVDALQQEETWTLCWNYLHGPCSRDIAESSGDWCHEVCEETRSSWALTSMPNPVINLRKEDFWWNSNWSVGTQGLFSPRRQALREECPWPKMFLRVRLIEWHRPRRRGWCFGWATVERRIGGVSGVGRKKSVCRYSWPILARKRGSARKVSETNVVRPEGASRMRYRWAWSDGSRLTYSLDNRPTGEKVRFRSQAMLVWFEACLIQRICWEIEVGSFAYLVFAVEFGLPFLWFRIESVVDLDLRLVRNRVYTSSCSFMFCAAGALRSSITLVEFGVISFRL